MNIGVVGGGVIGRATARSYLEHVEDVRVYDVVQERRTHELDQVLACDLVFVCLPTPRKEGEYSCDLSTVEQFFSETARLNPDACYVLRSTVPIGTTQRLSEVYQLKHLVHSPEFLTARCANEDAQIPARNIIGNAGLWAECGRKLYQLYQLRFPGVPIHVMTCDESEAVKLFQNARFAVEVAFWNELHAYTTHLGLNWGRVQEAILADGRISRSHTRVPGPDGKFGFGGTCLPKDLSSLVDLMYRAELFPHVCQAALFRNESVDRQRKR